MMLRLQAQTLGIVLILVDTAGGVWAYIPKHPTYLYNKIPEANLLVAHRESCRGIDSTRFEGSSGSIVLNCQRDIVGACRGANQPLV